MNWDALLVIGSFTLILGVVLLVPALWWARAKLAHRSSKASNNDIRAAGIVVIVGLGLVTLHQFYPDDPVVFWIWRIVGLAIVSVALWRAYVFIRGRRR